jgi:hypothetical protein
MGYRFRSAKTEKRELREYGFSELFDRGIPPSKNNETQLNMVHLVLYLQRKLKEL